MLAPKALKSPSLQQSRFMRVRGEFRLAPP